MGVLKNLQKLSDLEFYKCAEKLQDDITDFVLRDFGLKKSLRNVNQVIKDIEESDQAAIDGIFAKYGKKPNQEFQSEYPAWFLDDRKEKLLKYTDTLIDNIIAANLIHSTTPRECDARREKQNAAIGACGELYREFKYLKKHLHINLNWIAGTLALITREVKLLKGWRQSDNKTRRAVFENMIKEIMRILSPADGLAVEKLKLLAGIIALIKR